MKKCAGLTKLFIIDILFSKLAHRRGEEKMSKVTVGENEPLEKALRRFKKKIEIEGILKTLKARKHYEKPSEKKRRKRKMGRGSI
jgi:small subunit ribosomal protein S21